MSIRQGQTIIAKTGLMGGSSSYKGEYSDTTVYNTGDYVNAPNNNSVFFMCTQDNVVGKGLGKSYWVRLDNDGLVNFHEENKDSSYYLGLIPGNVSGTNYGGVMRFSPNAPKVNGSTGEIVGYAKTEDLPTKVSELENDSGYLTEHQDISGKADKSDTYTKTEVDGLLSNVSVDESNLVHKDTDETIDGTKTFSKSIKLVGGDFNNDVVNNVLEYVAPNGTTFISNNVAIMSGDADTDGDGNPEHLALGVSYQGLSNVASAQELMAAFNIDPNSDSISKVTGLGIIEGEGSAVSLSASANDSITSKMFGLDASAGAQFEASSGGWASMQSVSKTVDGSKDANGHINIDSNNTNIDISITNNLNSKTTGINLQDGVITFNAESFVGLDAYTKAEIDAKGYLTEHQDISGKADKSDTYTKAEVDAKVSSVYRFKGSVANYDALPTSDLVVGDVYNIESNGSNYAWDGNDWDKLSETINLTPYLTKNEASTTYATINDVNGEIATLEGSIGNKADKTAIPTKTSQLTNDSGYLTSHQDISGKANTSLSNINDAGKSVIDNRVKSVLESDLPTIVYWS